MARVKLIPIGKKVKLPVKKITMAVSNTLEATAAAIQNDFRVTTQTWKGKPKFGITTPKKYERWIGTSNEIYYYVNFGTRPHIIRPKNAKSLRFQSGYNAKTAPRVIASKSGGPFGRTVYRQEVHHPGTKGRFFDQEIARKWQVVFPKQMQKNITIAGRQ